MTFRQPTAAPSRRNYANTLTEREPTYIPRTTLQNQIEQSQEWIIFSPSQNASTSAQTQASRSHTAGLSRFSDLDAAAGSAKVEAGISEDDAIEDCELDSLDDGLHAFREPSVYRLESNQSLGGIFPTHDGLGTFPASSQPVQEQLWQHEQYNPKRKFDGILRRRSSVQGRLDTIDRLDNRGTEDKRIRIERWRMEQSEAMLEEIEQSTRKRARRDSIIPGQSHDAEASSTADVLATTPKKQSDSVTESIATSGPADVEPFWRRITRRFIREVIGINEPLLSVILGESLVDSVTPRLLPTALYTIPEQPVQEVAASTYDGPGWRDRLLQRIARELGVLTTQVAPHPGAFSTYPTTSGLDEYAGIPLDQPPLKRVRHDFPSVSIEQGEDFSSSSVNPTFSPTIQEPAHAESWGLEDDSPPLTSSTPHALDTDCLIQDRAYWERELDATVIFRFLRSRFSSHTAAKTRSTTPQSTTAAQDSARRAAVIRQHHPLVARPHHSPARKRRDLRVQIRRTSSSYAGESVISSRRESIARSGPSSRNYWDLGGSLGSGSAVASGGWTGTWGEV